MSAEHTLQQLAELSELFEEVDVVVEKLFKHSSDRIGVELETLAEAITTAKVAVTELEERIEE